MKAIFLSTDGDFLEARIRVDDQDISVMDSFGGDKITPGEEFDIEIYAGLYNDEDSWEGIFEGNPNNEKKLEPLGNWRYKIYGIVSSINPVLVDVGIMHLEAPITTHDERVIGESVAFRVERLDAS